MTIKRLICSAAVAVAVLASVAACGKSEETASAPADSETVVAASPSAPAGPAGPSPVLAIDRNALLRASVAGKSIFTQAEQFKTQAEAEFKAEAERLQADARAFQQSAAILAANVKAQRQRELQSRETQLNQKMQIRSGQIQLGMNAGFAQIAKQLEPILRKLMEERHATVLIDKAAIVLATKDDIDITRAAAARLDQVIKTVPIRLATPAEVQTAISQQQAAGPPPPRPQ